MALSLGTARTAVREATFSGRTSYDTGTGAWDGYVVLQAKFRQRLLGTSGDGAWLLDQTKAEIAGFTAEDSTRTKPDYYLLATNVSLGGAQTTGYKDRLAAYLGDESGLTLEDFDVWDYDKLRALLDDSPELVRTYCAWITSGDVLHKAMAFMERCTPGFEGTLARYLQSELLADQYASLEQAGHSPDERVPMAGVFVDLPVAPSASSDDERHLFLNEFLTAAAEQLSPSRFRESEDVQSVRAGRFALIGGPGQGKTTLGQFICQLFRAAILERRPAHTLDAEVASGVALVRDWCAKDGYTLPAVRRFPLRISLSAFAAALAEDPDAHSVLAYIVKRIATRTTRDVSTELFRDWLSTYPWVLVLDGLDEVPPSSNRAAVLAAVKDFMIELAESDADVLVLATTRPQGYSDEFDRRYYKHQYLVPLNEAEALRYGRRLSEVRFGENPDRVDRVIGRLATAASNEANARLMTSPLQVTIMTILVDRQGHPPQERWSLFSAYYQAIYSREIERDVPTARVLREQRTNVDAIHRRVGLLLQAESETAAGTDARLPVDRFKSLVRARLVEEGYDGCELDTAHDEIVDAAANRLVFLVGLEQGVVGFEIRSLQEFMAAEGLMEGGDSEVRSRLESIAASPSWRNVLLFAAGKCFTDRQHLRDALYAIAAELNESSDKPLRATLAGSRLAIDVLEEGTVSRQPKYARLFARLALRTLRLPPERAQERLGRAYHDGLEVAFREEIADCLVADSFASRLGAWQCMLVLADREVPWASRLCTTCWPQDAEDGRLLLRLRELPGGSVLGPLLVKEMLRQPAAWFGYGVPMTALTRSPHAPPWLVAFSTLGDINESRAAALPVAFADWTGVALEIGLFKELDKVNLAALADIEPGTRPGPSSRTSANSRARHRWAPRRICYGLVLTCSPKRFPPRLALPCPRRYRPVGGHGSSLRSCTQRSLLIRCGCALMLWSAVITATPKVGVVLRRGGKLKASASMTPL